jgi:hypothetical protein
MHLRRGGMGGWVRGVGGVGGGGHRSTAQAGHMHRGTSTAGWLTGWLGLSLERLTSLCTVCSTCCQVARARLGVEAGKRWRCRCRQAVQQLVTGVTAEALAGRAAHHLSPACGCSLNLMRYAMRSNML